jgi:hypothetical protein
MAEAMLRTIEKPVSEGRSGSAHRQSSVEQYEALLFHRGEQPSE